MQHCQHDQALGFDDVTKPRRWSSYQRAARPRSSVACRRSSTRISEAWPAQHPGLQPVPPDWAHAQTGPPQRAFNPRRRISRQRARGFNPGSPAITRMCIENPRELQQGRHHGTTPEPSQCASTRTGRPSAPPQPRPAESTRDYRLHRSPGGPARKGAGPRSGGVRRRPRQAGAGAGRARVRTRSGCAQAATRGAPPGRGRIRPKPGAVPAPSPIPGSATTPAREPVGPETRPNPERLKILRIGDLAARPGPDAASLGPQP
jgi:hypothetical protein